MKPGDANAAPPWSELPPDLLRHVAVISLRSHDEDVRDWLRLSLVCKDWHAHLQGDIGPLSCCGAASLRSSA